MSTFTSNFAAQIEAMLQPDQAQVKADIGPVEPDRLPDPHAPVLASSPTSAW